MSHTDGWNNTAAKPHQDGGMEGWRERRGKKKFTARSRKKGDREAIVELCETDVKSGSNGLGQMSLMCVCRPV